MHRDVAISVFGGVTVTVAVVVMINVMTRLDDPAMAWISVEAIQRGRVHELLFHFEAWGQGLRLPELRTLVHLDAAITVSLLGIVGARILRRRARLTPVNLGLFVLTGGLVLYGLGFVWLACGMESLQTCGVWLAWMLLGLLYAAVFCTGCGALHAIRERRSAQRTKAMNALMA